MFAPIPLSALHLTFEDFYYLFPENNIKMRPMDNEVGIDTRLEAFYDMIKQKKETKT